MADADEILHAQRAAWDGLAAGWDAWDRIIMEQLAPVGAEMVEALAVTEDQRHLDIASGTGEPGLSVARLAPRGRVVLTDLAPEMLDVAARRARELRLGNVETRVCRADDLPFADATFDSVSVRFGYMFFPDLAAATTEFARVLRPGGAVAASVWIRPDANPWTAITMQAIGSEVELPAPDPDGPSMFRCATPGQIGALFDRAGLVDVDEWDVDVELVTASPGEYWAVMSEHVSLAVAALAGVDDATRSRIRERAVAAVGEYERDGAVRVPGAARVIVGTRPR